jgi:hypothetical protein
MSHVFNSRFALRSEAAVARGNPDALTECFVAVEFDDLSQVTHLVEFLTIALRLR